MIIIDEIKNSLLGLTFIDKFYSPTSLYRDEQNSKEVTSPGYYDKKGEIDYLKLNINESLKGLAWIYEDPTSMENTRMVSDFELYVIVNTVRAGFSGKRVKQANRKDFQEIRDILLSALNVNISTYTNIETDAKTVLSKRYRNYFETNKQLGKIPFLVYRFDFQKASMFCNTV